MSSLQRQVGLFAIPLRSRQHANRTSKNQSGSRNEPDSGCVISVDPGLFPSPQHSPGSRDPALRSPPVAGFRHVFLQMRTMRQSETFLIIIDEDRKQFAVEGPLTDVQPWNRAVAAAQEVGRNVRGFDIAAASRIAAITEWQRHYGHLYRLVESGRIVCPSAIEGLRTHMKARAR